MDQYLSTVVIALITGLFSVITLIIQKKQDKVINKIDEQTLFIEKEKALRQKLTQKEKDRETIIHEIMILILDTNLSILKNSQIEGGANIVDDEVFKASDSLKEKFAQVSDDIEQLAKEYEMVLNMTAEFQREVEKVRGDKG